MDLLMENAKIYSDFVDLNYTFTLDCQVSITVAFRAENFYHLSGLQYLKDIVQLDKSRPNNSAKSIYKKILKGEFAAVCILCGGIFLTNVFLPGSAINTFFRALNTPATETGVDERGYQEFVLSSVVGENSTTQLTLSHEGILSFIGEGCVYPAVDGKVQEVEKKEDGYTVKISHSESFSEVIVGLDYVYYAVGEAVKANVPVGYSLGEREVFVTMYSQGELLTCFELSDDNQLSWVVSES